ncbi:hypothetical protein RND71_001390 [Anisodus tanguticus]|uniref:PIG-P domain-containing protein n=1 Tax=Anisodus tanguticus TaxID=243964 RepID=A0AAE1SXU6_9SOLA|nr:hypothetical protein RND71_001390 [Anisodus tanguticus]
MLEDKGWEDPRSVNSPRRILSFSKNRKATVFFPDSDDKGSGFGVSGDQGPKTSEVYGFVGSITTVVATVLFLVWAYLPEHWLHALGIVYYPSRYWALAVPAYAMMTIVLAVGFYIGLNFLATPSPTSFSMIYDEFTREPFRNGPSIDNDEQPIEPISDIRIDQINELMFNPK